MNQETSLAIMAICQLVSMVAIVALVIGFYIMFIKMRKMIDEKVDEALAKVQPILDQATAVANQAKATADTIGAKVDSIANKAETTAGKVGDTVQLLSGKVDQAVTPKVAAAIGIAGAAIKLVELYSTINKMRKHKDTK